MPEIAEIPSYRTPDGAIFQTRQEALAHLHRETYRSRAEEFANARGLEGANRTRAVNIIADYCVFEEMEEDS